ncbi:hypothetical protein AVEN_239935-1 [Araneus ventricosus]|uniref:DUF659 domain-containing protein n=1 Tax=Araneus ventricosus TaxID=182803 RepID=A0A4Y2M0I8_ARAVE|nr:hypothetical protein AVEN_239935-1 [Araneus ventricosus]
MKDIGYLLSISKLQSGTEEAITAAVHETLESWRNTDQVKCVSFDTTSVNKGLRRRACVFIQQKMKKELLWLACRYHVFNILLEANVDKSIGASAGPEILMFSNVLKFRGAQSIKIIFELPFLMF